MLFELHKTLQCKAAKCARREVIYTLEKRSKTHLTTIVEYLKAKYEVKTDDGIDTKSLIKLQEDQP